MTWDWADYFWNVGFEVADTVIEGRSFELLGRGRLCVTFYLN